MWGKTNTPVRAADWQTYNAVAVAEAIEREFGGLPNPPKSVAPSQRHAREAGVDFGDFAGG